MKPLVDKDYLLEKSSGMGGWTYTVIPEIAPDPHAPFGWVRVRGSVDGVEIRGYHLLPTVHGTNGLFLAVKADLRKKIGKEAGDTVRIVLYPDDTPREIPAELLACIADDASARAFFDTLTEGEKYKFVQWIYSAKSEKTRIDRMAKTVATLAEHRKFAER